MQGEVVTDRKAVTAHWHNGERAQVIRGAYRVANSHDAVAYCPHRLNLGEFQWAYVLYGHRRLQADIWVNQNNLKITSLIIGLPCEHLLIENGDNDIGRAPITVSVCHREGDDMGSRFGPFHVEDTVEVVVMQRAGGGSSSREPNLVIWIIDIGHQRSQVNGGRLVSLQGQRLDSA